MSIYICLLLQVLTASDDHTLETSADQICMMYAKTLLTQRKTNDEVLKTWVNGENC